MTEIHWLLVGACALFFGTSWLFVALSHGKILLERGSLSLLWRCALWPALPIFLALDLAWNLVVGTLCFLELPREILFTSRVKRHLRESDGWRQRLGAWWADRLNEIDEGHVKP